MAALGLLTLVSCSLCHWLLEPLLALGTALLNLAALPSLLVLLLLWLLAGRSSLA